jgi:hypothetical protein
LKQEKPLLIYPIGEFDDRPEDLIRFHGVSPQAVAKSGYKRRRALVTIELFKLDSTLRDLERGRAMVIIGLYGSLKTLAGATSEREKAVARSIIQGFTAEHAPHANCARSFERLFREDFAEAEQVFERAAKLVEGKS